MTSMEIARRFAELNEKEQAQDAYTLALGQEELSPDEELEAASYLFFSEADHRLPFTHFVSLFNRGLFQGEIWDLMTQAFYLPNAAQQKKLYEKNVKALSAYPYCFRKDFPAFEELTILFFPFDDQGFVPFDPVENRFGEYVNFDDPIIDRYFFRDLSKPILAEDVYSQYQLDYLHDNVRKSEWVAKENHIYLHYTDFQRFCAYLQVLSMRELLKEKKLVFLFAEEISRYPIDFKAEFGIDYSQYAVKPVGIREVKRMIWHTQLSAHNGADFFNEVLYGHPNLISAQSVIFSKVEEAIQQAKQDMRELSKSSKLLLKLRQLKDPTDKDIFVALFLYMWGSVNIPDPSARIVPALLFQPHFYNIGYKLSIYKDLKDATVLYSEEYEQIRNSPIFRDFRYLKTFTPLRRPTGSYAGSVRFTIEKPTLTEEEKASPKQQKAISGNLLLQCLTNRSYMIDRWDRLYRDSRLVRFEDGKLNPKATFTALAEFLDIPYAETMTYCSNSSGVDPETLRGNDRGFNPAAVYRTYDEYADDAERSFLEYFMRDVYEAYGYDFQYYGGEPVDEEWAKEKVGEFSTFFRLLDGQMRKALRYIAQEEAEEQNIPLDPDRIEKDNEENIQGMIQNMRDQDLKCARCLLRGLRFVNKEGQPLQMMTPLKLDPDLLEQPLYH